MTDNRNDSVQRPELIVFCGLPASGKTTAARERERETGAVRFSTVRFSTDEWMADLGVDFFDELRDRLQVRLDRLWKELLARGLSVILEDGTWKREERDELRRIAKELGAVTEIHYFDIPLKELWRRLEIRKASPGRGTAPITKELLESSFRRFDRPDTAELLLFDRYVFAIGIVVFGRLIAGEGGGDSGANITSQLGFALQFAVIAAAMACIIVTLPLNRRLRSTADGDLGLIRKIAKVMLNKKNLELDPTEQVAAAEYAAIVPTVLTFNVGYLTLLYLALGIQQVRLLAAGANAPFAIGLTVLLIAFLLFFIPYYIVRIQRARRYARDHADLLASLEQPTDA